MTSLPEPLVQIQIFHRNVHHNALCQNCLNGSALLNKMFARALHRKYLKNDTLIQYSLTKLLKRFFSTRSLDKKYVKMASLTKLLVEIQNNFREKVPHNAICRECLNGFAQLNKAADRALDKTCLKLASLPESLVQIQNNVIEMILKMSLSKWPKWFCSAEQEGRLSF